MTDLNFSENQMKPRKISTNSNQGIVSETIHKESVTKNNLCLILVLQILILIFTWLAVAIDKWYDNVQIIMDFTLVIGLLRIKSIHFKY